MARQGKVGERRKIHTGLTMAEASAVLNPSGVAWWPLARQKQRGNGIAWSIPVKIAIIGGGYVGLVSGACFAEFGVSVDIFEADPVKRGLLLEGKIPIYEPGLDRRGTKLHGVEHYRRKRGAAL